MFGFAHLIVSAERELRDNTLYARDEQRSTWWTRLWSHKAVGWTVVAGVLALFIIGGNAV